MVYDQIRESLGFTAAQTSAISSWGVAGCMAFLGVSGILTDRLGWRPVILAGIALQVFGEWLLYTFTAPAWVYAGAFLNGGGRTIGYLTLLKFLDSEFDRKYFSALIGVFYVFSYGGTLLGSSPFASLAADHPWQLILRWCNHLTTACGVAVAACLLCSARTARRNPGAPAKQREPFPWGQLLVQLKKQQCVAVFFCAASGIVLYWSCLSGIGKKYLSDLCGAEAGALGTMNTIVMVEMIFAGSVSLFLGNRRKLFQAAGCALTAAAPQPGPDSSCSARATASPASRSPPAANSSRPSSPPAPSRSSISARTSSSSPSPSSRAGSSTGSPWTARFRRLRRDSGSCWASIC